MEHGLINGKNIQDCSLSHLYWWLGILLDSPHPTPQNISSSCFFFTNVNRKSRKLHFVTEKSKILEFSKHLCMGENIAITDLQGHICVIVYLSCVIVHLCIYVLCMDDQAYCWIVCHIRPCQTIFPNTPTSAPMAPNFSPVTAYISGNNTKRRIKSNQVNCMSKKIVSDAPHPPCSGWLPCKS